MPDDVLNLDAIFDDAFKDAVEGKTFDVKEETPKEEPEKEETPKEETPKEEPVKEETPKEDPRISKLETELAELKAKAAEPPKVEAKKEEEVPLPEVTKEKWDTIKKDWKDLGEFIEELNTVNRQRHEMEMAKAFKMFAGELEQYLAPLFSNATETVGDRYAAGILKVHPDAIDILPEVEKWVGTLSGWQKRSANAVLDGGSVEETVSLYNDFKKATGRTEEEKKTETPSEEKSKEVSEKAKLMSGVKQTRTGVARTEDPNDFDAAFKEAVKVV